MRFTHYVQLILASAVAALGAAALVWPSHAALFGGLGLVAIAAAKPLSVASEVKGDKTEAAATAAVAASIRPDPVTAAANDVRPL